MKRSVPSTLSYWIQSPYRLIQWMMLARPIRFTRLGIFYILFSVGIGAAAINTGNNLLYLILGILLGFIVISGFLSDSAHWGVDSTWTPLGSLYAGQETPVEVTFTKGRFPGVALSVESHWGAPQTDLLRTFIPWVPSRGSANASVSLTPRRRGALTLTRCTYSTFFPFGLFRKSHTELREDRWTVYPAIQPLQMDRLQTAGDSPARVVSPRVGDGSLPFVLRDYRVGDPLRRIHWKMSAKRQRWIVKETEDEGGSGNLYVVRSWPTGIPQAKMEDLISFIASVLFHMHQASRPAGLSTPDAEILPECSRPHLNRLLEYLAWVDPYAATHGTSLPRSDSRFQQVDSVALWRSYGSSR